MRRLPKYLAIVFSAALSMGVLSSCSQSQEQAEKNEEKSQVVTIVTNSSWKLDKKDIAELEKATGVKTKFVNGEESGALDAKLVLRKEAPLGDLAIGLTANNIVRLAQNGVIEDLNIAAPKGGEDYLVAEAKGAVPLDRSDVCFNYDKAYFEKANLPAPKDYDDIAKPEYAKLSVIISPEQSDTGLGMLLGTVQKYGTDGYLNYWKKLIDGGAKVVNSWSEAYGQEFTQGEGKGKYPIVMSYSSSPYWSVSEDGQSAPTANVPGSCYPAVEYAMVLKNAKNPQGAKAVLEWLVGEAGQSANMKQNITYPLLKNLPLDPKLEKFAPRPENSVQLDPALVEAHQSEWVKKVLTVIKK